MCFFMDIFANVKVLLFTITTLPFMKKILSILTLCVFACSLVSSKAQSRSWHELVAAAEDSLAADTTAADTAIDVVAYFAKGDTCDYRITETKWKISGTDTIQTVGVNTYVRLVVTDSTSAGYKMTYTFTGVDCDTTAQSAESRLLRTITDKMRENVVGTTIEFETNEMGTITKINNLGQIKKKGKALFKESMKALAATPEMKALKKEVGIDVTDFTKGVDIDEIVDGYVEELKLLFLCHGKSFTIGESHDHDEATDDDYESDTYRTAFVEDSGDYSVDVSVVSIIPQADLKALVGGIVDMFKNAEVKDQFEKEFDTQVNVDGSITDRYALRCFNDGWPIEVIKQRSMKMGNMLEKVKQTYIGIQHFSERK